VRWMAFLDLDEFLFSPTGRQIPDVLRGYPDVGAVGACWMVYGTSGLTQARGRLVTEAYQWRSADEQLNRHVKSIVRTAHAIDRRPADPHHLYVDGGSVDELGRPLDGPFARTPTHKVLRVQHYVSRSESEARLKMERPRADNGELRSMDLCDPSLNEVHDPALEPFLPALRERL
jgi:hypothetical protein